MEDSPEKCYDPFDRTLVFVDKKDDLDPFPSEDGPLRAQMSCGHAVTPESLTDWCRHQLDQGNFRFKCPALVEGTKQCKKPWSYQEVRRLADLTVEEMQYFEENIARMAAAEFSEIQPCPQCKSNVERKDLTNLCVECPVCTADQKKCYQFCWQCQKPWKGQAERSDLCENDGCINKNLELLQICKTINLPQVRGATNCPSVRACPTCGVIVEHTRKNCKNLICPRCHVEFCFLCLKQKKICNKTSTPYILCQGGVAPRQTSIPVWSKHRQERQVPIPAINAMPGTPDILGQGRVAQRQKSIRLRGKPRQERQVPIPAINAMPGYKAVAEELQQRLRMRLMRDLQD